MKFAKKSTAMSVLTWMNVLNVSRAIASNADKWDIVREMAARPKFVTAALITRGNVIRATLSFVIFVTDRTNVKARTTRCTAETAVRVALQPCAIGVRQMLL